jgi:hypothetical protein
VTELLATLDYIEAEDCFKGNTYTDAQNKATSPNFTANYAQFLAETSISLQQQYADKPFNARN